VFRLLKKDKQGQFHSNIWLQAEGASARTQVTLGNWLDNTPCYTPEGTHIVFSSNRTGPNPSLWRIRAKGGGGITRITSDPSVEDFYPSMGTSGSMLAVCRLFQHAPMPQVWVVNASTGMSTQLREGSQPALSPDAQTILFVREHPDSGHTQLLKMDAEGGPEMQLTFNTDYDVVHPAWSPDGERILFASNEARDKKDRRNFDIWMMDADGGNVTFLTTNGSWDDHPRWSHTGEYVYFRSNRGGKWGIWRFKLSDG